MNENEVVQNIKHCLCGECSQCAYRCANWHNAKGVHGLLADALVVIEKQSKQLVKYSKENEKEQKT